MSDAQNASTPIADLDAGEAWEATEIWLQKPFRLLGVEHRSVKVRVPTGADVDRHIKGQNPNEEFKGLVSALTGLDDNALGRMAAYDRASIFAAVGELIGGPRLSMI